MTYSYGWSEISTGIVEVVPSMSEVMLLPASTIGVLTVVASPEVLTATRSFLPGIERVKHTTDELE